MTATAPPKLKMTDIARLAGVSSSTVSRALAGSSLVPEGTRAEILKLARAHGYVVNAVARGLRSQRTHTIAVAVPLAHEAGQPLSDPFFMEMLGHLADAITRRGYALLLEKLPAPSGDWVRRLTRERQVDGVIVIGQSNQHDALNAAADDTLALMVWGGHVPGQRYCTVGTDNVGGAAQAVKHLLSQGRRRVVFLGNPEAPELSLRYAGYLAALAEAKIALDPALVAPAHLTLETAGDAMAELLLSGARFDAVFAATDVIAIAALRALTAAGRRVPEDVALAGYDDIALAALTSPPLTTVRQDLSTGADLLVDHLLRRIAGEATASAILPTELVIRGSSVGGIIGPPNARQRSASVAEAASLRAG